MNIALLDKINLPGLLAKKGLGRWKLRSQAIGNGDRIHVLLAKQSPSRMEYEFAPTWRDTQYQAVSLAVDWQFGGLLDISITDLGLLGSDMHFIQRLGDGFLLMGARAQRHRPGAFERNAAIIDNGGNVTRHCFGDGIEQCLVDSQNRIITGYFDEGIFGNYGLNQPIGARGLILWSAEGERLWQCRVMKSTIATPSTWTNTMACGFTTTIILTLYGPITKVKPFIGQVLPVAARFYWT